MRILKGLVVIAAVASMTSCGNQKANVKSLETEIDSVSYAIGLTMSRQLKSDFSEVNVDVLAQAIRNGIDSTNLLIDMNDLQKVISPYFQKQQAAKMKEQQEKSAAKFAVVKKESEEFLAINKTKEGVKTTESGLQYIVLKEGKGKNPVATSKLKIHYHGTLIDGTVFDSSVDKKTPYDSNANQFIKGFTEGLLLMNKGAKYKLFIPQGLAYGANPRPGIIKPFAAIVFEVELLDIIKQ